MKTYPTLHALRSALSIHMESQGLTQLDVSRATGVPQSAISLFLGEKRGLNGDSALKIQSFLLPEILSSSIAESVRTEE